MKRILSLLLCFGMLSLGLVGCFADDSAPSVTDAPTSAPTDAPTQAPTEAPTLVPTIASTDAPTSAPSDEPTDAPTVAPTALPTEAPTSAPTLQTEEPTSAPTLAPTEVPTSAPTDAPTNAPTSAPTSAPTDELTDAPTNAPTNAPTSAPTDEPSDEPTNAPSDEPSAKPTDEPSDKPTDAPSHIDEDKNGLCDKCESVVCTHTYEDGYVTTKTHHWLALTCGCLLYAEPEAHVDGDLDGFCDVCRYVLCTHPKAESYTQTKTHHYYAYTCACPLEPDMIPHEDQYNDGICDECGYVLCTHTQDKSVYDGNLKYHWAKLTCGCEILPDDKELHKDMDKNDQCDICELSLKQETVSLDGKKIIFIGDSFIYYGCTVLERSQTSYNRSHKDTGLFYQLCRANGENVHVTNFTFGGHGLGAIAAEACTTTYGCQGKNHMSYLTDRYYDYVVMSGGRNSKNTAEQIYAQVRFFMDTFREVNPNVKFIYLVSSGAHNISVSPSFPHDVLNGLGGLEDMGVTIVDWGALVADIINGDTAVPDAKCTYQKNTFVVNRNTSDGYHPNQLAGYITTLMTYSAITGKSAVGQPYAFVGDESLSTDSNYRTFDEYVAKYYREGQSTNYPEVFASESDMRGIQILIDRYLAEKKFRDYNFAPLTATSASAFSLPDAILPTPLAERKEQV